MSITSGGTRKAGPYNGNGVTTAFPFTFKVFQATDLLVVQTDTTPTDTTLALTTNYTVSLNANQDSNPGGSVNMLVAPPTGYLLTIGSQVPQIQSVTLTNNGGFYPTVINTALDYLTILIQQVSEKVGRALTMPFSTNASGQLPPVSPGSLLGWKQDGSGIANVGASGVGAGGIVASNMAAGATGTALSTDTQGAATKATPADADKIPLFDSAAFWGLKSLTWANLKAAFLSNGLSTIVGSQMQISGDVSPFYEGSQATLLSGAAYALNGNIQIMKAWTHNTRIDTSGNFTGVGETGIATVMFWGEDDVLRTYTAPSVTAGTVPTFGALPTYTLDMKTGIIGPNMDAFPNFTANVAANALTGTLTAPFQLNFRNATLATGTPLAVAIGANLTLTVPSGATLGTTNGVAARLVWLVAYNGGTPVLCVANLAGGLQLDETNLISPTTISAGATAANVIYSASAVGANSPYRVIGFTDVTEATAGTWATAPSTVQPVGGQASTELMLPGSPLFASSLATSGYQKLPGGLIIQWGNLTTNASGVGAATFPIAFPNAALIVTTSTGNSVATNFTSNSGVLSTTGCSVWTAVASSGAGAAQAVNWIAIGK